VERLNTLCTTSAELAGTLDIHRISQLVVGALITHAAANVSSLVLVDDHSGQQVFSDASAGDGKQDDNSALAELLAADPASQALADHLAAQGDERRIITAQFKPRTHLSGELRAGRGEGAAGFSTEDLDLLITLANMASKAIESAELHRELKDSYFNTVQSLANSLEARDNYTAKHAQRVTDLALRLARHLRERFDLTDEDFETLAAFGPLHDVGKIGMPDELLNRQGPFTAQEREIFSTHSIVGEEIIRPLEPSPGALALIRHHHENWDGEGYPDHLSGQQIHVLARILRVADSFDSMVSRRPYSSPMPTDEAVHEIWEHSGRAFDPVVAEALAVIMDAELPRHAVAQRISL
jgi:HD-GYP domain-containing protein (c-di-GMP phosphodiesterase class II)